VIDVRRRWALVLAGLTVFWVVVGVLVGVQASIFAAVDAEGPLFGRTFWRYFLAALVWIPATPIPWLLARRFPIRRDTWRLHVPLHLAVSVVFGTAVHLAIVLVLAFAGLYELRLDGLFRIGVSSLGSQLHLVVLVYWVIVGGRHAWVIYGESRRRELEAARLEVQLSRATLEALRLQLRPHFLFNALHTINLLWRTGRSEAAQETLERLSALLRGVLDEGVPQKVRLARELALARDYLAVEKVRFGERLEVRADVEAEVMDALVPSFLLQPIIENAVSHGIEAGTAAGSITIGARRRDSELLVEVEDDGAGADPGSLRDADGIGLGNTRRRLEALYGAAARLEVTPRPAGGTAVRVTLPLEMAPAATETRDAERTS